MTLEPAQLWPLALGAIINERNKDDHDVLGGSRRPRHARRTTLILAKWWDVRTTSEVIDAIEWLWSEGHRKSLAEAGVGSEESFLAWDMCRAASVAGWAFVAYLLDRETAWRLMVSSAKTVQASFSSFAEVGQSYVRGLREWADAGSDTVKNSELALAKLVASDSGPYRIPWKTPLDGAPPPGVDQKVVNVTAGGSIDAAIREAGSGGRVVLGAGSYDGSLTPPHSIEIAAAGDGPVFLAGKDRPTVWVKPKVSVSLRGVTVLSRDSSEGKSLNATSVPGGFLRLHECTVAATHHAVSVREEGFVLLSRSTVEATGQSGIWCDGGSVVVTQSEIRDTGAHGVLVTKGAFPSAIEDSTIVRAGEVGVFAQSDMRLRRVMVEAPGKYGVVAQSGVKMSASTVRGSKGWGVEVQEQGRLELAESTVEGSHGANLDVKNATVHARSCVLAKGVSSGVTLQDGAHATFIDTKIEDNAQGSLFTLPGAHVLAAACVIRGQGPGVFLQGARATFARTAIEGGPAIDVRGEPLLQEGGPAFVGCAVKGEIVVRAGSSARFGACTADPAPRADDGATVTIDPDADVEGELQKALAPRE